MEYRKDIQMLRGVAVALVVLFHLGIAGFQSGFLGVDVFFVISGYLMAQLYDPNDVRGFFIKRARRLLPAYFATVLATLLAALVISVPSDYGQVVRQSLFATFFASNIGFWLENSYFDKVAFKPLLHLWSLGVEIQFYLIVPALVWVFSKLKWGYIAALAGSALACFIVVGVSPKTSFFWLPFRLWEFLIGFGIARHVYRGRSLPWVGLAALVVIVGIPFLPVDGQSLGFVHGHPGLIAMAIALATGAVLSFGIPARAEASYAGTLLARTGDYSYSIYLVHFPLIVLFLYQPLSGTVLKADNLSQVIAIVVLMAVATALLYRFIEAPFRKTPQVTKLSLAAGAVVLAVSQFGFYYQRQTTPEEQMHIYDARLDRAPYRCGKLYRIIHPTARSCQITSIEQPSMRVLLAGNSHADSIKMTFADAAQARNVAAFFLVENNPLIGGLNPSELVNEASTLGVDAIVLHYSPDNVKLDAIKEVARLASAAGIETSFIMPVPVWDRDVPQALLSNSLAPQNIDMYRQANAALIDALTHTDFSVYQTADVLCTPMCQAMANGRPLYFDESHLTLTGSEQLRGVFDGVIDDLLKSGHE